MNVACIIIAGGQRTALLDTQIVPAALRLPFEEVVVVGDYHDGSGARYYRVPALTKTTIDALVKRDVGTLATTSPWLFYLSDDHAVRTVGALPDGWQWRKIGVPHRFCEAGNVTHVLNMGLDSGDPCRPYCAGHAGLYSRALIRRWPWTAQPHDRCWDLLASREHLAFGSTIAYADGWTVEDLTPETRPWQ